ncbi:hypothetical protein ACFWBH_08010 [Streptomyces sp. NPDC059999]
MKQADHQIELVPRHSRPDFTGVIGPEMSSSIVGTPGSLFPRGFA